MAFTGDLEHLHIVDIIQLLHTTRKSGTFSVKGPRGESRIIFSNGYIVGASHLNNRIRIGTVLVKMNAITQEDLRKALEIQKSANTARKPLMSTLIDLGKLSREEASKGLRKLIEITIVELMSWTHGTFTVNTEDIAVTPECSYPIGNMEQATSLDAQMVLMDALRVFDERERDRQAGMEVPSYEELFADVVSSEVTEAKKENREKKSEKSVLTADDLGLGELDHLERKMPQFSPVNEVFNPVEIHRKKIRETLVDFTEEEQEAFVSFLEKFRADIGPRDGSARQQERTLAVIFFSEDELIKHSLMTICKNAGVLVFTTDGEEELDSIIAQCFLIKTLPILVLDNPGISPEGMMTQEKIVSLRRQIRGKYPLLAIVQLAPPQDYSFTLQAYQDGARAVLPKPSIEDRKEGFIREAMQFLDTFKAYINSFCWEQDAEAADSPLSRIKDRMLSLREIHEPSRVSFAVLQSVAERFERSVTFIVRQTELIGEKALGVYSDKDAGPVSAAKLKIPLTGISVFRDVIEKGEVFYGESNDEVLQDYLFTEIGSPLNPTILLLPMKSNGKTMAITYADFGSREASPVQNDDLVILATQAGLVVENILYRKLLNKASIK
jgi:hypothetical protein